MYWKLVLRRSFALFVLFIVSVSQVQACGGCMPTDVQLYVVIPLTFSFFIIAPIYVLANIFIWLFADPKSGRKIADWFIKVGNSLLLGYADFAAIVFIQRVLLPSHLKIFEIISPLFFNPLTLAIVAYYAVKRCPWADHLFQQGQWLIAWPFFVAIAVTGFQGYKSMTWDPDRTVGLVIFLIPIVAAYFSIPEKMRPFWRKQSKKGLSSVRGLHMRPAVIRVRGSICKLCGETIVDREYVQCADCSTPMHQDCWEWNGRSCVVYGCQSRQVKRNRKRIKALGQRRMSSFAVAGD